MSDFVTQPSDVNVRAELDDASIRKLEAHAARYEVTNTGEAGLRLRVFPSGAKKWSYWYRNAAGDPRRFKLGDYPGLSLSEARKAARRLSVRVDAGEDPAGDRKAERTAHRARKTAKTFGAVCDDFVKDQSGEWRPSTRASWLRYIESEIKPALGGKLPAEVTADDVTALIDRIKYGAPAGKDAKGATAWKRPPAPVSAARCFEVLRRLCAWAVWKKYLPVSPCELARPFERRGRKRKSRAMSSTKAYTDAVLRAIFTAAAGDVERAIKARRHREGRGPDGHEVGARAFSNLLGLVAHTGVRAHDARAARWENVDEGRKLWTVPEHKTSDHTGAPHVVPLSAGALAVLARIREANMAAGEADSPWLFPAPTASCEVCARGGHMDKDSRVAKRIRDAAGVEGRGLLHRLRDTIKTRMSEHGIDGRASEAILGHVVPGIAGIYDHAELLPQRREALAWWSGELQRILRTKKRRGGVVAMAVRA